MNRNYKIILLMIIVAGLLFGYYSFHRSVCTDIQSCVMIQNLSMKNMIKEGSKDTHKIVQKSETTVKKGVNDVAPTKKSVDNIGTVHTSDSHQGVSFSSQDLVGASLDDHGVSFHSAITPGASITDGGASVSVPTTTLGSVATLSTSGDVSEQEGQPGVTKTRTESTNIDQDVDEDIK